MHKVINEHYANNYPMTEHQILEKASEIIASKFIEGDEFTSAKATNAKEVTGSDLAFCFFKLRIIPKAGCAPFRLRKLIRKRASVA